MKLAERVLKLCEIKVKPSGKIKLDNAAGGLSTQVTSVHIFDESVTRLYFNVFSKSGVNDTFRVPGELLIDNSATKKLQVAIENDLKKAMIKFDKELSTIAKKHGFKKGK